MPGVSNGGWSGIIKTFLTSPVGGWALAVVAIAIMAYMSFKDRQATYHDMINLRADAMPVIRQGTKVAEDNYQLLKIIDHKTSIILDMLKDEKDKQNGQ